MEPAAQRFNLLLLLPLVFLAIFLGMGGYYLGLRQGLRLEQPSKTQPQEQTTITEKELPIGISLLKNPMVLQWSGTVKGKFAAKDENSITIEDENRNNIVIQIKPLPSGEMPPFSLVREEDSYSALVDLMDVPLNSDVQSEFLVIKEGKKSILVGVDFIYFEKSQE